MEYSYGKYLKLVEEGKIEEAVAYRAEHTPDYLYKFFWLSNDPKDDAENEKRFYSLEHNKIWFASAASQNDPYEFKGIYLDLVVQNTFKRLGFTAPLCRKYSSINIIHGHMSMSIELYSLLITK